LQLSYTRTPLCCNSTILLQLLLAGIYSFSHVLYGLHVQYAVR
jgi:hypothetical protein